MAQTSKTAQVKQAWAKGDRKTAWSMLRTFRADFTAQDRSVISVAYEMLTCKAKKATYQQMGVDYNEAILEAISLTNLTLLKWSRK